MFTILIPKMQTSLLKRFLLIAFYFVGLQFSPAQKRTYKVYINSAYTKKIIIKILIFIFCSCLSLPIFGQTETQSNDSTTFKISDYSVTGLAKEDLSVKISNVYESNNAIMMDFDLELTEDNYFTDVSEKVTGMSGATTLMGTTLHYDKEYHINAKFGFDNNLLSSKSIPVSWEANNFLFLPISQNVLMKHLSFTMQTKVNHQLIKVRVNLKNPLLHEFIQKWFIVKQPDPKLQKLQKEQKEQDAFNANYGYLGLEKNSYFIHDVDAFVTQFGHGKIPADAVMKFGGENSFSHVLLKTVKPASFYEVEDKIQAPSKPVMPLFEMGILPEGTLILFDVRSQRENIDGKYVQIHLNTLDPFSLDMKNKYQGKIRNYWVGLIPVDALDFGNTADMNKYLEYSRNEKALLFNAE